MEVHNPYLLYLQQHGNHFLSFQPHHFPVIFLGQWLHAQSGEVARQQLGGPAGPAVLGPAVVNPAVVGPAVVGPAVAGPAVAGPAVLVAAAKVVAVVVVGVIVCCLAVVVLAVVTAVVVALVSKACLPCLAMDLVVTNTLLGVWVSVSVILKLV